MRRVARLHVGLVLAKALYKDRDAHWADLKLLREGRDGLPLPRQEKLALVKTMLMRAGRATGEVWLPPAVLWGLGIVGSGFAQRHEKRKTAKKDFPS